MHNLIIFIWIFCVAAIAFAVIYYNRKHMRNAQKSKREPLLRDNFAADEEFIDPVVASPDKGYNKVTQYAQSKHGSIEKQASSSLPSAQQSIVIKNNYLQTKPTKPIPIIEKKSPSNPQHAEELFVNGIITLMIMAKPDKIYAGYELLQALLSSGLRFGKRNIFHRYQHTSNPATNNPILFSLASAVKPGIFEMPKMGAFSTPGLVMFMQISDQEDPSASFELMLETARQLLDDLGGEIWDQQRQLMGEEQIADIRNRLAEYERGLATADMFA